MKNNSTQIKSSINSNTSAKPAFNTSLIMIGENIRKRREALGMSQTELANEVGTDRGTISRYELATKEMGVGKLFSVAAALGCTPEVLVQNKATEQQANEKLVKLMERIQQLPETARNNILGILELAVIGAEHFEK